MVRTTEIIDIRVGSTDFDMVADIKKGLKPQDGGEKTLPTLLLYDEVSMAYRFTSTFANGPRLG